MTYRVIRGGCYGLLQKSYFSTTGRFLRALSPNQSVGFRARLSGRAPRTVEEAIAASVRCPTIR